MITLKSLMMKSYKMLIMNSRNVKFIRSERIVPFLMKKFKKQCSKITTNSSRLGVKKRFKASSIWVYGERGITANF